jgi:outer membrane protein assembly factor BamB
MCPLRRSSLLALCLFTLCLTVRATAAATCTLNTTNRTVTICTPANGATVGTTFHINAGTKDSLPIQYIEAYVANVRYVIQHQNFLDATITVPPGTKVNLTVQAHDTGGVTFKQTYIINISAGSTYSISPQNPTVSEGATRQFTASVASTWGATCGSITSGGLFTAPLSQPACKVTGTASDGSGHTASTNVNVSSPITISPSGATTVVNNTQQFSANVAVTWAASCGSINSSGLFTAPATAGSCTITATASSGTPYTAKATDTVTSSTPSALNYTTWKNDNARDGLQSKETILTPANVNASSFGQIFSASVDGRLWAQPLYMSGVTIGGAKHNVVYVATANDSVYAIDGDTGTQLWKVSLLGSGETPASGSTLHSSVQPIIGITGTPVIDPATGTLYAVTQSGTTAGTYNHRLHALDITNGSERFGAPVVINTGGWSSAQHLQRPGLLLANGTIYIAFSSNEDIDPYHGWVFAYSADTMNQVAVWNVTPGGNEGGIWMGGGGIAADAGGDLFLTTGNGDWSGATEYGQSAVRLSPTLSVVDYFTPIAHVTESNGDKDLGSGGVLLLPTNASAHPHEAVICSKLNIIYVLDRDHMGEIGSSTDNVLQQVTGQLGASSGTQFTDRCFSTPAFWNNNLYFIGNNDAVKQFSFNPSTGLMSTTPTHKDTFAYLFPGGQPVVSSNGNSNGIVWAIDWTTGTLRAYDATNVSNVLYVSSKLGTGIKFTTPTVVNGHVYVGLGNNVVGMGLKSGGTSCAPPSSPGVHVCAPVQGGSYTSPVSVLAAGKPASGTLNHMELWIDGTKINNYFSSLINTSVPLSVGSHALTVVEDDSTGAFIKSSVINITVH